jgi:hypothetical protein
MERKKRMQDIQVRQTNWLSHTSINDSQLMLLCKVWIYLDDTPQCINAHVLVIVILTMFHINT